MGRLVSRRRGTVIGTAVLAGVLAAGGATAYAASGSTPSSAPSSTPAKSAGAPTTAKAEQRLLRRGVHGQVTVKNRGTGQYLTREWQRGQITGTASGTTFTVKSPDGTSWTWTAAANAKVTRDGRTISESALKTGDQVLVVGEQAGSANDATRIYAPTAAPTAQPKTSTQTS
ncbi:hypothetical protein [Streptacidiphilus sp. P02-A3a]|uniref:hypothetical protein n=1 Tax=Streptacidiphilus sp. P02-A3a TaxID=2704468 RepID=UPI0015FD81C1|nr:hypothetical protein [Streptacidiphilus sp. P02-A3a]QMU73196.1 hypothetical protein GXP74_38170 [Streptacidiphilus sp. P02-A3a]